MATFIGYNSINQFRNFVLTDFDLIKRDLLNALNIRQGESPMRPLNGTSVWNFIFEPQSPETIRAIETEIQRVVSRDPRIVLNSLVVYSQDNGVLVEMQVDTVAGAGVEDLIILFDQESQFATYV
jgi:phage baseplate assembly protein W